MTSDITVIIPYYNERETILFTLQRIAEQTSPAKAAIFVNSSSTDDTSAIIDAWIEKNQPSCETQYLNIFENTNNPAMSTNVGLKLATTEWIALMDCGQDFQKDWLERQMRYANECGGDVICGVVYLTGEGWIDRCAIAQTYGYRRTRPCLPTGLIRKSVFDKTGPLLADRRSGFDLAWFAKLGKLGITRHVNPEVIITYIGTNFSASLPQLFRKSVMYAKPSVAVPGYFVPYVYAALSIVFMYLVFAKMGWALGLFGFYFLVRTFVIPTVKSGNTLFFREHPAEALLGSGVVGLILDFGRVLGTWRGIFHYHVKLR
jgi:glycosyltransferase involved in cell wall biosynthesis